MLDLTENLAAGTGEYTVIGGVDAWADEVEVYNPEDPENHQALHFTQVVWKGTTELGCAFVTCSAGTIFLAASHFLVCEYHSAGNVIGEFE